MVIGKTIRGERCKFLFKLKRIVTIDSQHGGAKLGEISKPRVGRGVGGKTLILLDRRLRIACRALIGRPQPRKACIALRGGPAQFLKRCRGFA